MSAMAFSAASLESYSPIIFMPAAISVTTEHLWLVVSRPTKYFPPPDSTAKAGWWQMRLSEGLRLYTFSFLSPWDELAERQAKEEKHSLGDLPNQLSVNRINSRLKLFIRRPFTLPAILRSQRDTPSTFGIKRAYPRTYPTSASGVPVKYPAASRRPGRPNPSPAVRGQGRDRPIGRLRLCAETKAQADTAKVLAMDEARRDAANIAKCGGFQPVVGIAPKTFTIQPS
jgi:hypothetical protein